MNYAFIAILAVVLTLGGWFVGHTLAKQDARMAAADTRYSQLVTDMKNHSDQDQKDAKDRENNTAKQTVIVREIHDRDTAADNAINNAKSPDKTDEQAAKEVTSAYGADAFVNWNILLNPGLFSFRKDQVQMFTATKIDRDRLFGNLNSTNQLLDLEKSNNKTLVDDYGNCKADLGKAQKSVEDYQKVAKKGKLAKLIDKASFPAGFGVGVAVGRASCKVL